MNRNHKELGATHSPTGRRAIFLAALLAVPAIGTSVVSASVPACGHGITTNPAQLHAECTSTQALMPDGSTGVAETIHGAIIVERESSEAETADFFQAEELSSEQSVNKSALGQRAVETRALAYLSRLDAKATQVGCANATPRDKKYAYTNLMAERHELSETQRLRLLNAMNTSANTNTACN